MLQYSYRPHFPPTRQARTGADQCWVDYDPIVDRPPLRWPDKARLAVMVCPAIFDYEFTPPGNPWLNPWARTGTPDGRGYRRPEFALGFGASLRCLTNPMSVRPRS